MIKLKLSALLFILPANRKLNDVSKPLSDTFLTFSQYFISLGIAWTAKMVQPRQAANHGWLFDKIFGDDEFMAAGQLIIPPKGRKPSKAAKDNTYVS